MESLVPYIVALVPTVGIATLFFFVMKNIIEGDRKERLAQARWEAERRAEEAKRAEENRHNRTE